MPTDVASAVVDAAIVTVLLTGPTRTSPIRGDVKIEDFDRRRFYDGRERHALQRGVELQIKSTYPDPAPIHPSGPGRVFVVLNRDPACRTTPRHLVRLSV